jgi:phosphoenolpyruvate synthase/pyruvate phosphate dikinase
MPPIKEEEYKNRVRPTTVESTKMKPRTSTLNDTDFKASGSSKAIGIGNLDIEPSKEEE